MEMGSSPEYAAFWRNFGLEIRSVGSNGELNILCPFHDDTSPSFRANQNNGGWICHSCGLQGFARSFVREWLIRVEGIPNPSRAQIEKRFAEAMGRKAIAAEQTDVERYVSLLAETPTVQAYLSRRGLPYDQLVAKGIVDRYRIGYDGKFLTFPIFDEQGECLFLRLVHSVEGQEPKSKSPEGARSELWPLRDLLEAEGECDVILCEGEMDALTAIFQGYVAVTGTGGANGWRKEWTNLFRGKRVYIAYDGDRVGRKAALDRARDLSSVAKDVFILPLPDGEDLNSLWQKGVALPSLVERAQRPPIRMMRVLDGEEFYGMYKDSANKPWIVEGLVRPGQLVLLAARPKSGKTTLITHLLHAIVTDGAWLGHKAHRVPVVYANYEMDEKTLGDLYRDVFGPDCRLWPYVLWEPDRPFDAESFVEKVIEKDRRFESGGLLIIDPVRAALGLVGDDENNAGNVAATVRPLQEELCRRLGWTVVLVHHLRKGSLGTDPDEIAGSAEWFAVSDVVMLWNRAANRDPGDMSGVLTVVGRIPEVDKIPVRLIRQEGTSVCEAESDPSKRQLNAQLSLMAYIDAQLYQARKAGLDGVSLKELEDGLPVGRTKKELMSCLVQGMKDGMWTKYRGKYRMTEQAFKQAERVYGEDGNES